MTADETGASQQFTNFSAKIGGNVNPGITMLQGYINMPDLDTLPDTWNSDDTPILEKLNEHIVEQVKSITKLSEGGGKDPITRKHDMKRASAHNIPIGTMYMHKNNKVMIDGNDVTA